MGGSGARGPGQGGGEVGMWNYGGRGWTKQRKTQNSVQTGQLRQEAEMPALAGSYTIYIRFSINCTRI